MLRKKNRKKLISQFLLLAFFVAIALFFMLYYDGKEPVISLKKELLYTNSSEPISFEVEDDQVISELKIDLITDKDIENLSTQKFKDTKSNNFNISLPAKLATEKHELVMLKITAKDRSWRNLYIANESVKNIKLIVDDKPPFIDIISNSYRIEQGGAAAVVFKASDDNLKELYIETNTGNKFKVSQYLRDNYYAALLAWDLKQEDFRAYVVAIDKAGNKNKKNIRYFLRNVAFKKSNIVLTENFLNGKIKELANIYAPKNNGFNALENFKFVNESLRDENAKLIRKLTDTISSVAGEDYNINPFFPLKGSAKVASFGDHRFYTYNKHEISSSYHLGLDLASVAKAPIIASNAGKVIFAGENGIYGLSIIIDHGFGLYSLYGHCSSADIKVGDRVKAGDMIARTGTSGLALGDHVHFGILIGSTEVRPGLFQDKKWIDDFIIEILNSAKKIILSE